MLDRAAWEEPRVFAEIQRLGAVAEDEMDRVFNRGIGMALVVDAGCGRRRAGARSTAAGHAGQRRSARSWPAQPGVRFR